MKIYRTTSEDSSFIKLVDLLNAELKIRDGEDHAFYNQFNSIEGLQNCVVVLIDDQAVSCGAIKPYGTSGMEIKRMYTHHSFRGQGLASKVLSELERWAKELGMQRTILETGKRNPEAVALYKKYGYKRISNFGQYMGIDNSLCFEKQL